MTEKLEAKSQLIEKTAFAVLPILFTCVVYLMGALDKLTHEVTVLNAKISLVVTLDNKQATNSGAELAREKLRQELEKEIQRNRDMIHDNQKHISIIEDRMARK
jgi:intracellular septation protein A